MSDEKKPEIEAKFCGTGFLCGVTPNDAIRIEARDGKEFLIFDGGADRDDEAAIDEVYDD